MSKCMQSLKLNILNAFCRKNVLKIYKLIIYILLFFYGLNFFNLRPVYLISIISLTLIKSIMLKEIRITSGFICTLSFSILFYIFVLINHGFSFNEMIYYLFGPIGLFIAANDFMHTFKNKERAIYTVLLTVGFGFVMHATLNMINCFLKFGFSAYDRVAPDIWTGTNVAATGIGLLFPIAYSFLLPVLLIKSDKKRWYEYVIVIFTFVASIYTSFILANRTMLFIIIINFFVCLIAIAITEKKKRKFIIPILAISLIALVVFYFIIKNDTFNISNTLSKIPLFDRIFKDYEGNVFYSSRFSIYKIFFSKWLNYPFGGEKIPLIISRYCHNVWLDIYYIGGVLPFVAFIILTISMTRLVIHICVLSKDKFFRISTISLFISMFLLYMVETVIQGNVYVFLISFLFYGLIDNIVFDYKSNYIRKYKKTFNDMSDCKIVFISHTLMNHQISFANALSARFKDNFKFIEEETSSIKFDYITSLKDDKANAVEILKNADIIICGTLKDYKLINLLVKKGKLIFNYEENPIGLKEKIRLFNRYKKYQPYNSYYLCNNANRVKILYNACINPKRCFKSINYGFNNNFNDYEALLQNKAKNKRIEILFVNKLIKETHPEKCIVVAKYLKKKDIPFRMRIVGDGEMKNAIHSQIIDGGFENSIKLLGMPNNRKISELLEYSNIILTTSDYDPEFSMITTSGMENGCVVVAASKQGSTPYLVNVIKYDLDSDKTLYEALDMVSSNRNVQHEIGKLAFNEIKDKWTLELMIDRLVGIIEAISDNKALDDFSDGVMSKVNLNNK